MQLILLNIYLKHEKKNQVQKTVSTENKKNVGKS